MRIEVIGFLRSTHEGILRWVDDGDNRHPGFGDRESLRRGGRHEVCDIGSILNPPPVTSRSREVNK